MISANEARNATYKNQKKNIILELRKIEIEINSAIAKGSYDVYKDGTISKEAIRELEKLGYEVTIGSYYNTSYYKISWEK